MRGIRDKRELSESDITKHTWGFEWDDIKQAAKEIREETFGPDQDYRSGDQFCFNCTEELGEYKGNCPHCGEDVLAALMAKMYLAENIDLAWPHMGEAERANYKIVMKRFRLVNPEFRAMWKHHADLAAAKRRLS